MNRSILLATLTLLLSPSAIAQGTNYNYRYGDSRIIIQSETGLTHPSATYIGSGTLSKSAQGVQETGAQPNGDLPRVNHGGFIGTPGDNLYGNSPIRALEPKRLKARQPAQIIYVQPQQSQQPKEYTYVPGQNAPLQYGGDPGSDATVHVDASGAAVYGANGERHF